jgi:hypothetical protein
MEEKSFEVPYSMGNYVFSSKKVDKKMPLVSFDNSDSVADEILRSLSLSRKKLVVRSIPQITPMGSFRDSCVNIDNLNIGNLEEDELGQKKKVKIKFELPKGSYATVALIALFLVGLFIGLIVWRHHHHRHITQEAIHKLLPTIRAYVQAGYTQEQICVLLVGRGYTSLFINKLLNALEEKP